MRTVISLLGTQLDRGMGVRRWEHWRPTVSIFQHDDLLVDQLILLRDPRFAPLADVVVADVQQLSPETTVEVVDFPLADAWDFEEVYGALHDFAVGRTFAEDVDLSVHITTGTHVAQICLFLLSESRHLPATLLQTGPPRRQTDRAGTWSIIDLNLARYDQLAARFAAEHHQAQQTLKAGIPTLNAAFNRLIARIEQVALASEEPVLLTGPTGAGKSELARRIYTLRRDRRQVTGPLIEVNCATLRGDAAMSALFGHERGAFTGAERAREGLLRAAHGGVLFLDEIGELGPDEQALLLRALEDKRWLPLGADREVSSTFQLIAGTNRDLRQDVADGRFREDLLARIDLWHFALPGLAQRPEDIAPNLDYELARWTQKTGRRVAFNHEARERFLAFATSPQARWTANFRDLSAAVTRMATLAGDARIDRDGVEEEIGRLRAGWSPHGAPAAHLVDELLGPDVALDPFDRVQLEAVLAVCRQSASLSEAGRTLFAVSRTQRKSVNDADRLRKYLARHGLDWAGVVG